VVTKVEYDRNGNQSKIISPRGYDAAGGSITHADHVTSLTYDAANRPTRIQLPFDSRDGTERQYQHRAYDPNGNLLWSSLSVTSASAEASPTPHGRY
jgi:YD repeat-containing protein